MSILLQTSLPAATAPATTRAVLSRTLSAEDYLAMFALWGVLLLACGLVALATGAWRVAAAPRRCAVPREAAPLWIGGGLLMWWFIAAPTTLLALARAANMHLPTDAAPLVLMTASYVTGILAVAFLHSTLHSDAPRKLGLVATPRPFPWRFTLLACCAAAPLTNLVAAMSSLVMQSLGIEHESTHGLLRTVERAPPTSWVPTLVTLNAMLLAPAFEELVFRGHLQTALAANFRRLRWPAIVITSLIFALIHEPWSIVPIFVLSLAIGYAYERTGNLWVAMLMHVAFNATSLALFFAARG